MASAFFNGAMYAGGWMQHMLFEAAHNGDLDLVRGMAMLLGEAVQAARLRGTGPLDGMGALHIAASKGRLEVCRYLVEELRLDVDDTDQEGRTPLIIAIVFNHVSTVEYLLDRGADANKASHNGLTPIHFAICLGFVDPKVALYLYPDDATLFSNRSLCWHRMGDGGKALLDAHECRKLRSDWPKAYYRLGAALMLLKDYESACEALYNGFKLDPGNSEIEDAFRYPFCLFWSHYGNMAYDDSFG
uniref:Uncharacterized protein n=1 Tax=Oryza glumipatula TaxID=40148 RepID=A0A0D9YSH3_9ORYZ